MAEELRNPTLVQREIARVACFKIGQLSAMLRSFVEEYDGAGTVAPVVRPGLMRLALLSDITHEAVITDSRDESDEVLTDKLGGRQLLMDATGGAA
ncbi:MAG: hypothetical protein DI587_36325 [Variovorax paradoxus]|nr:MAG: hypothetical protein DI583_36325 [Variovorax paradoxus]PZQ00773.1 MAG: hypothetical protein DI587_36325 [Variovorax paradoxus]